MFSNDTLLATPLLIASILFALFSFLGEMPRRSDMYIFMKFVFQPFSYLTFGSLLIAAFLAFLNSFFESSTLYIISTLALGVSAFIFLPIIGIYCIVLLDMVHSPHFP
jgi:hypothetical protein